MQFSDTSGRIGIVELLEDYTNTQSAITSSYPLKSKTRDINLAYAYYMMLAIDKSGRWEVDDTNQSDYPIITFDINSGQDNYAFTTDGSTPANQILDVYSLRIYTSGQWKTLTPIDRAEDGIDQFTGQTGIPTTYDITSNGVIFYPTPNYTLVNGIELYVARTPVYFLSTDTTKQPGIPDMFHEYLALRPAYRYAMRKQLPTLNAYKVELLDMERQIKEYYSQRTRMEKPQMKAFKESNK